MLHCYDLKEIVIMGLWRPFAFFILQIPRNSQLINDFRNIQQKFTAYVSTIMLL